MKDQELIRKSLLGLAEGIAGLVGGLGREPGFSTTAGMAKTLKLAYPTTTRHPKPAIKAKAVKVDLGALRKLQGQYMGMIRYMKPQARAKVAALRAAKGYPAAIKLAKALSKS